MGKMRQDSDFKHLEHFVFLFENNEKYKIHGKKRRENEWREGEQMKKDPFTIMMATTVLW